MTSNELCLLVSNVQWPHYFITSLHVDIIIHPTLLQLQLERRDIFVFFLLLLSTNKVILQNQTSTLSLMTSLANLAQIFLLIFHETRPTEW